MKNFLLLSLLRGISILPLGVARGLGGCIGWLAWMLNVREAKITKVNLACCFPEMAEAERNQLARQSMMEWGKTLLEIPVVWGHSPAWLEKKIIAIEGQDIFERLRDQGRGLIIVAPHLGNWEVVGLHWSRHGELTSMFSPTGVESFDNWVKQAREKVGATLVPADNRGVIRLLKALKEKKVLGILPDQTPAPSAGGYAPFYGLSALTMTLIHNLLKRSGGAAVFCYAERVAGGFRLVCREAPESLYSEDETESLTGLNHGVERCVEECPPQYQWEYKRFRRRAPGEPRIYTKENT